jgi:cysteine desulfurase/selenocysteine lyase
MENLGMANLGDNSATTGDWGDFRRQMPVSRRWAFLDHAAVAPLSGPASTALTDWSAAACNDGSTSYPLWVEKIEHLRDLAAGLIGAQREEIGLVGNTTAGINIVAGGFPWQPGDNVVLPDDEFPSNQYPWMQLADLGVEVRRVNCRGVGLDADRLASACDARTRIITASWVGFSSGWRSDVGRLAEIAHQGGALLFLDAIQGLGVFPLDVSASGVDFMAADGHKWMLGPEGAGIFYVRREHLDLLRPVGVGWNSVVGALDFSKIDLTFKDTAARYEGGSVNLPGMMALGASLDLLARFGTEAISRRVIELTDLACRRLEEAGAVIVSSRPCGAEAAGVKSGIVSFEVPGRDCEEIARRCIEHEVVLSCRGGRLRISPHAYNTAEDIQRLVEVVAGS